MHDPIGFAARCLLRASAQASLATQSLGQPFASLVTPAVTAEGDVLLVLSSLATHTRHLMAEARCALMVVGAAETPNPQTAPRLTLLGRAEMVTGEEGAALRAFWVSRHEYAAFYADFSDFAVWRVRPAEGYYVGGFARADLVSGAMLAPEGAAVAAIRAAAGRIVAHCNADHADALARIAAARGLGGAWRMLDVDPDGFELVQDERRLRVAFEAPVADGAGVRAALVQLSK